MPADLVDSGGSGGAPTGPAGGDLAGSYPDPTLKLGVIVDEDVSNTAAIQVAKLAAGADGRVIKMVGGVPAWSPEATVTSGTVVTASLAPAPDLQIPLDRLVQGSEGQWLKTTGGAVVWAPITITDDDIVGQIAIGKLEAGTPGQVLTVTDDGSVAWVAGDTSPGIFLPQAPVAATTTPVPITGTPILSKTVFLTAPLANTQIVYVGDATVTSSAGGNVMMPLPPNTAVAMDIGTTSGVYVVATSGTQTVLVGVIGR